MFYYSKTSFRSKIQFRTLDRIATLSLWQAHTRGEKIFDQPAKVDKWGLTLVWFFEVRKAPHKAKHLSGWDSKKNPKRHCFLPGLWALKKIFCLLIKKTNNEKCHKILEKCHKNSEKCNKNLAISHIGCAIWILKAQPMDKKARLNRASFDNFGPDSFGQRGRT